MSIDQSGISLFRQELASSLHDHWKSYLFEGIVLLLLGAAAIIVPQIATLTVALLIGWLLLFSGVVGLITTFQMRPAPGFWWSLVSALIAIAAGIVLLASPVGGAITLTFVLIAFFIIEGIASIMFALDHKQELPGSWGCDALQRYRRSGVGRYDFSRPSELRRVGDRTAGRHQYGVWRCSADRDGIACPQAQYALTAKDGPLVGLHLARGHTYKAPRQMIVAFDEA